MKNLTVKQKLIGMVIVLSLMVAGLSVFFINRFGAMAGVYRQIPTIRVPQQQVADAMVQRSALIRLNLNEAFGVQRRIGNFAHFAQQARENIDEYKFLSQALLAGSQNLGRRIKEMDGLSVPPCRKGGQIESLTQAADPLMAEFEQVCERILDAKQKQLDLVNDIGWYDSKEESNGAVKQMVEAGREMERLARAPAVRLLVFEMRRQEKNMLQRSEQRYIERLGKAYRQFSAIASGQLALEGKRYFSAFETISEKVLIQQRLKDELKALIRTDLGEKQKKVEDALDHIKARASEQMTAYANEAFAVERSGKIIIATVSVIMVLSSLLCGWLVSGGINRMLGRIITGLSDGAEQVASASGQVSASSQSLAEGSTEQASAIEETSASLEEMASMTRQNAAHSTEADSLMKEAGAVVQSANDGMTKLTLSMKEIHSASEETSKIIKTIDEIAFQTNLLALNAAVEAARAGEAGAGFAVVADEVRNLAMRAADAAKSTAELIEGTVDKVKAGSQVVATTNETFAEVAASASKVAGLVSEIAAASAEQSQGIGQVNTAVAEMDKVVQQNAANAEESASAAEEMSAQAEQMKQFVDELVALIGATNKAPKKVPGKSGETVTKSGFSVAANQGMLWSRRSDRQPTEVEKALKDDAFGEF